MKTNISAAPVYQKEKNKVLDKNFRPSDNFFHSDKILKNYLKTNSSAGGFSYMSEKLNYIGKEAAGRMNELSLAADKFSPQLTKRNYLGENINEITFHPTYWELMKIAVKSEMFRVKWEPSQRKKYNNEKRSRCCCH